MVEWKTWAGSTSSLMKQELMCWLTHVRTQARSELKVKRISFISLGTVHGLAFRFRLNPKIRVNGLSYAAVHHLP